MLRTLLILTVVLAASARMMEDSLPQPQEVWYLPDVLSEISGITWVSNDILGCVQDENGIIFHYQLSRKKVIFAIDFKKRGDYEDITFYDGKYFVLRSDGDIIRIRYKKGKLDVDRMKTELQAREFEAICSMGQEGKFLICPKGKVKNKDKDSLVFYRISQKKQQLKAKRLFTLKKREYESWMETDVSRPRISGMTVHPKTGHIYVLSSKPALILVLHPQGKILRVIRLDARLHPQPEGICFLPDGRLIIADEARYRAATLTSYSLD